VSKEKFELVFLAGGTLLNVLGTRLRRDPATPLESVGAAMYTLGQVFDEHRGRLADPDTVALQIGTIRQELCASKPRRAILAGLVDELVEQVSPVEELADAAELVRRQISAYLRWRFGGWTIS
jgi:hypothetical protein